MHCIILCLCVFSASLSCKSKPALWPNKHPQSACQAVKGLVVFSPELEAVAEGCALSKVQVI